METGRKLMERGSEALPLVAMRPNGRELLPACLLSCIPIRARWTGDDAILRDLLCHRSSKRFYGEKGEAEEETAY